MNLTITVEGTDQLLNIELPGEFEIVDFKAYLESETQIPPEDQQILFNGKLLEEAGHKYLADWKLDQDSMLLLRRKAAQQPASGSPGNMPVVDNPFVTAQIEQLRQQLLSDPAARSQMDPDLDSVLNDKEAFKQKILESLQQRQQAKAEEEWLYANPDDPASQEKILTMIRQQAIDDNMRMAYEESPESFTRVHMLYINCEVNGVPVKAFVDSGAQTTIMTPGLAAKCGIDRLIDRRFQGEALGVGSAKILGRVHSAPLKIGDGFFSCSFTVLDSSVQMLLGLDMLRRFQATIDLKHNQLVIGEVSTDFLPESQCPNEFGQPGGNSFAPGASAGPAGSAGPSASKGHRLGSSGSTGGTGGTFRGSVGSAKKAKKSTPAGSATSSSSTVTADPHKVDQLVAMGFSRAQAEQALVLANNNLDLAAGMLFD